MPTDTTHHLSADQVAIQLGIPIPRLRTIRRNNLVEGQDWMRDPEHDARTLFSPEGVARIRALLTGLPHAKETEAGSASQSPAGDLGEASAPPTLPASEKQQAEPVAAPPAGSAEELLTVVSHPRGFPDGQVKHHPNPRVISARRANGEVVYVRVAESRHFVPQLQDGSPMTLKARLEGVPPNWSLIGRCPRFYGRW